METMVNFKKLEVTGVTKEEALAKAPFEAKTDATQAYKNWKKQQVNGITEADTKAFMVEYLAKKTKNVTGAGCYITVEPAVLDTRERPYSFKDKKNELGARKYQTVYQLTDAATGVVLAETNDTKAKAKELARSLYTKKGFRGNIICTYAKKVVDGEPIAFETSYTPSKGSHMGTYIVFGIERA